MNVLEVENLGFAYGDRQALRDVSFSAAAGRFTALLGPNGAGKSTLIALLTRLYELQQGEIRVVGFSLRSEPREALRRLGVVFQQSTLDLDLSVEQNLRYHAALHGMPRFLANERIEQELQRQQLIERRKSRVRELNGGHPCCTNQACCCSTKPVSASTRVAARHSMSMYASYAAVKA